MMKKKLARVASLFVAATFLATIVVEPVNAKKTLVSASQDDVYDQLLEAAKANVITNNFRKCLNAGSTDGTTGYIDTIEYLQGWWNAGDFYVQAITNDDASNGNIFHDSGAWGAANADHTTAIWLEQEVTNFDKLDGYIWCTETGEKGNGKDIFGLFAQMVGKSKQELVCNGGNSGLLSRVEWTGTKYIDGLANGMYPEYKEGACDQFNVIQNNVSYVRGVNYLTALQNIYEEWKASREADPTDQANYNPYLPEWDAIGSFNNIDGYFSYDLDYQIKCKGEAVVYDHSGEVPSGVEVYPISYVDNDFDEDNVIDSKITIQRHQIHLNSNPSWSGSLGSNTVTNCVELVQRIDAISDTWNGISWGNTRSSGYKGILLDRMENACANLKDSDGNNAWDTLRARLNEVKNNPDASAEEVEQATANLVTLDARTSYMTMSGTEDSEDGMVYKCLEIDGLEVSVTPYDSTVADIGDGADSDIQRDPDCYTNAGSLGWILCPVIQAGGDAITKIYDYIAGFMQINTNLFNTDDNSMNGTYIAWNTFRNIANVAFVLIFLFVIFSQLTGVGLDNYGIKKVLPKLIIGAILINISYIVCQLAVDVANIVGYGIKGLFNGMQNEMLKNAGDVGFDLLGDGTGMTKFASDVIAGTSLVVIIVGVVVAASFLASSGGSLLVPVLLGLITILISIVSFLVMLAIRQALAVILVVVSPLAFICYMLPNTKAVFKKWFDGMKGMLLAFPICSAIVYGSEMVATILLIANANGGADGKNVTNFALGLSAAIITVVPIFLVPKAISKSMGAISGTVERISRAGRGMAHRGFNGSALRRNLDYGAKLRRAGLKVAEDGSLRYRSKDGKDHKRAFTKLGKMKLDAQRSEIANEVIARGGAGRFAGDGGLDRLNSRIYSEQEKEEKYKATGRQSQIMLGKVDAVDEKGNVIMTKDENGKETTAKIDSNSVDQLQYALTNAMRNNDSDSIKALQNILTQKGDAGREAVRKATQAFEHQVAYTQNADGSYTFDQDKYNNMSEDHKKAIKTAASNIMENHAKDYKDNNRSMYDWAASNSSGVSALEAPEGMADSDKQEWAAQNARTLDGAHGAMKSGSLKQSQLINMDDGELSRLGKSMMDMRKKADNLKAQADAASNAGDFDSAQKYSNMQSDLENQIAQIESTAQAALDSEALTGAKANRIDDITKMANFSSFQNALNKKSEIEKKPKEYYDPSASWEDIRGTIPKIK